MEGTESQQIAAEMVRLQQGFPLALLILKGQDLTERLKYLGLSMEAADYIANMFDPRMDPRADLWTYIEGWVLSRFNDESVYEDRYQEELERCGLSNDLAVRHMDPQFAMFRDMQGGDQAVRRLFSARYVTSV